MTLLKIVVAVVVILVALVGAAWLGTRVSLQSFDVPELESRDLGSVPPPENLPAPVARYVALAFGGEIPIVESALVIGSGEATFNGLTLPIRFKFYHDAGHAYYHFIQAGWFGQPLLAVNERFLEGVSILDIPGQYVEDNPEINASANQGMWSEAIWLPSIWFTDERVRWEAIDDNSARLVIPDAADEEAFTVSFDPQTHLIDHLTTLRYQSPGDTERTLWTPRILEWDRFNGVIVPSSSTLQWGSAAPWVEWHVETVLYNVNVSARLAQFGGEYAD
jgi:hypothetical protein